MSAVLQWILIILGVFAFGAFFAWCLMFRTRKKRKSHNREELQLQRDNLQKEQGPEDKIKILPNGKPNAVIGPEIETTQSEQQKFRKQLRKLRKERYQLQRRQNSYMLLNDLSGGIQEMLGLEKMAFSSEDEFCRQLEYVAQNWSMRYKIDHRKAPPEMELFSPEIEESNVEALKSLIRKEEKLRIVPAIDWSWDTLVDELLPCLEKLMSSAKNSQAKDCRYQLEEISRLLKNYSIYPIWYHDEIVRTHPNLKQDYVPTQEYAIPALFLHADKKYTRIGTRGYVVITAEEEN